MWHQTSTVVVSMTCICLAAVRSVVLNRACPDWTAGRTQRFGQQFRRCTHHYYFDPVKTGSRFGNILSRTPQNVSISCFYVLCIFTQFLELPLVFGVRQSLLFKRRIRSHLPFAGIIRGSPYSPR